MQDAGGLEAYLILHTGFPSCSHLGLPVRYPAGTPAMTSRGLKEADFEQVADFLEQAVNISLDVQKENGKLLKDFLKGLEDNAALKKLREDVEKFASSFEMPGFDVKGLA